MVGLGFPVPPTKVYSPEYVEVEFCELRLYGVLGSSVRVQSVVGSEG
jgi:hypothetical protein